MKRPKIDKSALRFGEPQRIRDERHRRFIASLTCIACGAAGRTQAAHIRSGLTGGTALKPCDSLTIPLCVECHIVQGKNEKEFHGDVGRVKALAKALYAISGDGLKGMHLITEYRRGL